MNLAARLLLQVICALVFALISTLPARAGCNPADLLDAMKKAVETTAVCKPVCEDNYRCYAAAILAADLTYLAKNGASGDVEAFCKGPPKKVEEIMAKLRPLLLAKGFAKEAVDALAEYLNGVQNILALIECSCETKNLNLQNESSFGSCADQLADKVGCGKIDIHNFTIFYDCTPGNIVSDAFDAVEDWVCDNFSFLECNRGAPPPVNYTSNCPKGSQSDNNGDCHPCSSISHGVTAPNGECGCDSYYTPDSFSLTIGQSTSKYSILKACVCKWPMTVDESGHCLCPKGMQWSSGTCVACAAGEKYVPYHFDDKGNAVLPQCQKCALDEQSSKDDPAKCVKQWSCNAEAGEVPDPNTFGKTCLKCTDNQRVVTGAIVYGTACQDCGKGQKVSADHLRCVPKCPPGEILSEASGRATVESGLALSACVACAANEYAVYEKPESSVGSCQRCEPGTTSAAGQSRCMPLDCGPGAYQDPANPNACKSCPPTQIWVSSHAAEKNGASPTSGQSGMAAPVSGSPPGAGVTSDGISGKMVLGHCGCGENQKLVNGVCVCAADAVKIANPTVGGSLFACACPEGAVFDKDKFACSCPEGATYQLIGDGARKCVCPRGERLVNGKCTTAALTPTNAKDCTTMGVAFVKDARKPGDCRRCPGGRVANDDHTRCIAALKPISTPPVMAPIRQRETPSARDSGLETRPAPTRQCGNARSQKRRAACNPATGRDDARQSAAPPSPVRIMSPPRIVAPVIRCPQGMRPSPSGGCVPVAREFGTAPRPLVCPPGTRPGPFGSRCLHFFPFPRGPGGGPAINDGGVLPRRMRPDYQRPGPHPRSWPQGGQRLW